jgi:signal transduction histidine kinase
MWAVEALSMTTPALVVLASVVATVSAAFAVRAAASRRRLAALLAERTRERDEARRALERSGEEERMAAHARMAAAVAHELRHPLFALQAAAHVMQESLGLRADLAPQLRTLRSETTRLDVMAQRLLDFTRPAPLRREAVRVDELVSQALAALREQGYDKPPVVLDVEPGLPDVSLDRRQVAHALLTLMRNAASHARAATRVEVRAYSFPHPDGTASLRFSVSDDGPGIAAEDLPRVFEPFFTRGPGIGLGLTIVRRSCVDHGGTIRVESVPGRGATFHIDLPLVPAEESAPEALSWRGLSAE